MFKRIFHEDWTSIVPIFAFAITFIFFLVVMIRALRMKKPERERLSSLPLDNNSPDKKNS